MDREIRKEKNIADIDDLRKRLGEIWNNIQLDTIRAPLAGVPRRLAECEAARQTHHILAGLCIPFV